MPVAVGIDPVTFNFWLTCDTNDPGGDPFCDECRERAQVSLSPSSNPQGPEPMPRRVLSAPDSGIAASRSAASWSRRIGQCEQSVRSSQNPLVRLSPATPLDRALPSSIRQPDRPHRQSERHKPDQHDWEHERHSRHPRRQPVRVEPRQPLAGWHGVPLTDEGIAEAATQSGEDDGRPSNRSSPTSLQTATTRRRHRSTSTVPSIRPTTLAMHTCRPTSSPPVPLRQPYPGGVRRLPRRPRRRCGRCRRGGRPSRHPLTSRTTGTETWSRPRRPLHTDCHQRA